MSTYILGPAIASVTELAPGTVATIEGRIGIVLDQTTPTEPGGKVNFTLAAAALPTDVRPNSVFAVYVNPPSSVPPAASADWFMSVVQPRGSVVVPAAPVDPGKMQIVVPGVTPGIYYVQTVLEYDV